MLSHLYRFHGHGSLRFVYRHGTVAHSPLLSIKYSHNPKRVHSRFAIVISKKIYKSAVKRNRLRRRIYGVIGDQLETIKPSYDVIIIVHSAQLDDLSYDKLTTLLGELLVKQSLVR